MKKNIVFVVCSVIILLTVGALCAQKQKTSTILSGWSVYENQDMGFSVLLPNVGTVDFDREAEVSIVKKGTNLAYIANKNKISNELPLMGGFKVQTGFLSRVDDYEKELAELNRFFKEKAYPTCKIEGWGDRDVQFNVTVYGNSDIGVEPDAEADCSNGFLIKVDEKTKQVLLVEYSKQDWTFGTDKENDINIDQQILSSFRFLR